MRKKDKLDYGAALEEELYRFDDEDECEEVDEKSYTEELEGVLKYLLIEIPLLPYFSDKKLKSKVERLQIVVKRALEGGDDEE